jgi:hypothetical protein
MGMMSQSGDESSANGSVYASGDGYYFSSNLNEKVEILKLKRQNFSVFIQISFFWK